MNPAQGDIFSMHLQTRIMEQQKAKLDKTRADLAAAIEIAEALRDWLAYGYDENDPKLGELNDQLQQLRGE